MLNWSWILLWWIEWVSRRKGDSTTVRGQWTSFCHLTCPGKEGAHWFCIAWEDNKRVCPAPRKVDSSIVTKTAFCAEDDSITGSSPAMAICLSLSSTLYRGCLYLDCIRIKWRALKWYWLLSSIIRNSDSVGLECSVHPRTLYALKSSHLIPICCQVRKPQHKKQILAKVLWLNCLCVWSTRAPEGSVGVETKELFVHRSSFSPKGAL